MTKTMWWEVAASLALLMVPVSLFFSLSARRRRQPRNFTLWLGAALLALVLYVFFVTRAART